MTVDEKKEICAQALIKWAFTEMAGQDMKKHDHDIETLFTSQVLLRKFDAFGIDIVLPDPLLIILYICTESNPGQVQIILKELLESIKERKGPIQPGYAVSSEDFSHCFATSFPIISIPHMEKKYRKLWDGQKRETQKAFETDNKCDTVEWWMEVMQAG